MEVSKIAAFFSKMIYTVSQLILLATVFEGASHSKTVIKFLIVSIMLKFCQLSVLIFCNVPFPVIIWVTAIKAVLIRFVLKVSDKMF